MKTIQIEHVRNIGPKTVYWLQVINIWTLDQLEEAGALNAYIQIERTFLTIGDAQFTVGHSGNPFRLDIQELPLEINQALL